MHFTVPYAQIKSLIKRDSITLATKHVTITTIFKYMPPNNSHITLHTHRNPHPAPGINTIMTGSSYAHTHTHMHARTHACTHTQTHTASSRYRRFASRFEDGF